MSQAEVKAAKASQSIGSIKDNPVNAPHKIIQYGFHHIGGGSAGWLRLPSVLFALLFLMFFYLLMRQWFGRLVGALAALIFATTPLILLTARSATPASMLLIPIALIASFTWLYRYSRWHTLAWFALATTAAISFNTPGMLWFVLISFVVSYKRLLKRISKLSNLSIALSVILFLVLIAPIVAAAIADVSVIKTLALIPDQWTTALDLIKNLGWSFLSLGFRFPEHEIYILGRLPILNLMQIVFAGIGLYAMWNKARREIYGLLALTTLSLIFATINRDKLLLIYSLPALMIFVGAGLRFVYVKWRKVFPLNPLPKALAIILIFVLVGLHTLYGLRYALVAWPHNTATRNSYMIK
jgi:4-amino-4-deoxy-L-arabinose transferase-like glycosyltransferase